MVHYIYIQRVNFTIIFALFCYSWSCINSYGLIFNYLTKENGKFRIFKKP